MPAAITIGAALTDAARHLAATTDTPRLEAEALLAHALGTRRAYLFAWPERPLDAPAQARFADLLERRLRGEPLAYLTGEREFWSLRLQVTPDVLIPRPETELVVELALRLRPRATPQPVADLGTGSGAIALALASEAPAWQITATDRSEAALAVARRNAERLGLTNVEFALGDWCTALTRTDYALIVSNPPYIAQGDPHLERSGLPFEPRTALASGDDGLDALRSICATAGDYLIDGGWLILEHGASQGPSVQSLLQAHGFVEIATHADLAGLPRATLGRRQ